MEYIKVEISISVAFKFPSQSYIKAIKEIILCRLGRSHKNAHILINL